MRIKWPEWTRRLLNYDVDGTRDRNRSKREKVNLEGMSDLSKTIFNGYQKRKTKEQKDKFIKLLENKKINVIVEESKKEPKSRNLIVGDVSNAKIILTAHYDTPSKKWLPHIVNPDHPKTAVIAAILSFLFINPFLLMAAIVMCCFTECSSYLKVAVVLMVALVQLLLIRSNPKRGIPNPYNYNDNTSGVITICELMLSLTEEEKKSVAFVLFDNEEIGIKGSECFSRRHEDDKLDNKLLINIDCVAYGSHILLSINEGVAESHKQIIKDVFTDVQCELGSIYGLEVDFKDCISTKGNSDHKHFPSGIGVGAFCKNKLGIRYLSRIHTANDTVFEYKNIEYLVEGLKDLIATICEPPVE